VRGAATPGEYVGVLHEPLQHLALEAF
jgi:hypothetical protein